MKYAYFYENDGRIRLKASIPDGVDPGDLLPGVSYLLLLENLDIFDRYVFNGRMFQMPERPSNSHEWVYQTRRWAVDQGKLLADVRTERDRRLAESDWVVLPDVQMSPEKRAQWMAYRQALRDVTSQPDLLNISWPVKP